LEPGLLVVEEVELAVGRQPALRTEDDGTVVAAVGACLGQTPNHVHAQPAAGVHQGRHALTGIGVLGQPAGLLLPGEDVARRGQLGEDDELGAPLRRGLDLGDRGGPVAGQVADARLVLGDRDADGPVRGVGHAAKMVER
jgi:hypothetical protein